VVRQRWYVSWTGGIYEAADNQFSKDTYYGKVDTSLPERQQRWGRRADSAENGE